MTLNIGCEDSLERISSQFLSYFLFLNFVSARKYCHRKHLFYCNQALDYLSPYLWYHSCAPLEPKKALEIYHNLRAHSLIAIHYSTPVSSSLVNLPLRTEPEFAR